MSDRPIIIKKVIKKSGGHGSTAWKIALADFMTALMIVFFILWVKAITDEPTQKGISEHFSGKQALAMSGKSNQQSEMEKLYEELVSDNKQDDVSYTYDERSDIVKAELSSDSLFRLGSAQLTPKAGDSIARIADSIASSEIFVHVYGYADNTPISGSGILSSNLDLSTNRALEVTHEMQKNGIDYDHMTVHGEGELNPISDNDTISGRAKNRRVEIFLSMNSFPTREYNVFSKDAADNLGESSKDISAEH